MTRWLYELALDLVNGFHAARRQRAMIAAARAEDARLLKLKAKIVRVGEITPLPNGGIHLGPGWEFRDHGEVPEYWIGMDGATRFMGYTAAELKEIHAHRADWVG